MDVANDPGAEALLAGRLQWRISQPFFAPAQSADDTYFSVKDPSIVFYGGRWHLFCSVRGRKRSHQIEYLCFTDWDQTDKAERRMLTMHPGFFCAPQVFYFTPHKKWYLICRMRNTQPIGQRWTDCISHGELLRDGYDQHLEVDPRNLRLVFQGVLDRDRASKKYGEIPWRLGMLVPMP